MSNYTVKNVDEFIAEASEVARPHLQEIRTAVQSAFPEAEEKIGYGKPYYKHHRWLVGFDFYKQHINFEVWEGALSAEDRKTLEDQGYKTGSKTFQIRYDQKVPVEMIQKLVKNQVKVSEAKMKAKAK